MTQPVQPSFLTVNATPADKESIAALTDSILRITAASCGDAVKEKALDVLSAGISPQPISITGCSFGTAIPGPVGPMGPPGRAAMQFTEDDAE